CILGINAMDATNGVTDNDWDVVQVKRAMIESAEKVVALSISEKLNSSQRINVCGLDEIDMLITELTPGDPQLEAYVKAGIKVL
ncbi:MAG: DeoR/GlpR transcriptional regulator, partial [Chitinophagaceae bacterium]|nr:DeoR/GlpR transcriptional regulator [Chitinophagaceae bacterium]